VLNVAVLVSGGGTNLQALLDSEARGENPNGKITLVVASKPGVFALERAAKAGVEGVVVRRKDYENSEAFDAALLETLKSHNIDLVVLAGFLSVLGPSVIEAYPRRILNVHPALIPSFCGPGMYGLRPHQAALARGCKVTGATVHFVNEECDGGPILLQKAVEILPGDTPEVLQKRVMEQAEWKLLPKAVAMVCAMAIPAFAYNTWETEEDLNQLHGYSAFQIFKGVISKDNETLSNVGWGSSITKPDEFLAQLTADPTIGGEFKTNFTAQDVLAVISKWHNSDDYSIAFARVVCHYLYPDANANPKPVITDHTGGINIPESGYYLIVDTTYFNLRDFYHAYNSFFLLNVPQAPYVVLVNHKVVKPYVEKEVYDDQDGTNEAGFGSSADHAINEEFQFKLIATLPASRDNGRAYDYYDEYAVLFNDTLSKGITYDRLDSVVIESKGIPYDITGDSSKYTIDTTDLESHNYFVVGIPDVKTCVEDPRFNLNDGATITVTYTAHLNDKAAVNTTSGSTDNKNKVQLQYSNNPRNSAYWGFTPESEVRVYTYQLNNTKYHDDDNENNKLEGAGFRLYSGEACNDEDEIKLKKNADGTYSRYFGTEDGEEMFSDDKGQFNVKGLDAGTYYLKETTPPTGYSACDKTKIVISATHDEHNVNLSGESNLNNKIINKKAGGITLPSTGGIGTTLFYVVGGGPVGCAIVFLVTKKRMENK